MAGLLQPGLGIKLDTASMTSLHRCIVNRSEGWIWEGRSQLSKLVEEGNKERWFWRVQRSTFAGDILFIPIPATATIPFNISTYPRLVHCAIKETDALVRT
ncbi:uncharacterized protein ARMOST_21641 [Armillaria ostoyae]|uniref:Uncharacterized protein n=1 Tax=Armillaria ostoyae TaxID=47428 RepID=A0A284SAS0_ARMOS|nr:uncharacterized protein ARMOST_21641 [Armillaria ostoyae]